MRGLQRRRQAGPVAGMACFDTNATPTAGARAKGISAQWKRKLEDREGVARVLPKHQSLQTTGNNGNRHEAGQHCQRWRQGPTTQAANGGIDHQGQYQQETAPQQPTARLAVAEGKVLARVGGQEFAVGSPSLLGRAPIRRRKCLNTRPPPAEIAELHDKQRSRRHRRTPVPQAAGHKRP